LKNDTDLSRISYKQTKQKKDMFNRQTVSNPDVPDSTVIKQLSIENGKLKSEIQYLENELANKNRAIEAFKKWQRQVTQRTIWEWIREAKNLQEPLLTNESANTLRELVTAVGNIKQIKSNLKSLLKATDKVANNKEIQELIKDTEEDGDNKS